MALQVLSVTHAEEQSPGPSCAVRPGVVFRLLDDEVRTEAPAHRTGLRRQLMSRPDTRLLSTRHPNLSVSEPERPWRAAADRGVKIHLQTTEWSGRMAGGRRGLVAPQNTFLENIVRRSNGKDEHGTLSWEIYTLKLNLSLYHRRINCPWVCLIKPID